MKLDLVEDAEEGSKHCIALKVRRIHVQRFVCVYIYTYIHTYIYVYVCMHVLVTAREFEDRHFEDVSIEIESQGILKIKAAAKMGLILTTSELFGIALCRLLAASQVSLRQTWWRLFVAQKIACSPIRPIKDS